MIILNLFNLLRRSNKDQSIFLCCFSPPVMLATMIIEVLLAIYTFFKYHKSLFKNIVIGMILLLALFQLAEYQVCGNQYAEIWSRIGLAAITILPLLGLYLISLISHKSHFLKIGFIITTIFLCAFLLIPKSITNAVCGGNYVIFNSPTAYYLIYNTYYFGYLMLAIWEALTTFNSLKNNLLRQILKWLIIGYLSFMIPMGLAYAILPQTRIAVASIMCGFAIIFAFILTFQIMPKYYKYKNLST